MSDLRLLPALLALFCFWSYEQLAHDLRSQCIFLVQRSNQIWIDPSQWHDKVTLRYSLFVMDIDGNIDEEEDVEEANQSFLERRAQWRNASSLTEEPLPAPTPDTGRVRNPKGAGRKRGNVAFRAAVSHQEQLLRQEREQFQCPLRGEPAEADSSNRPLLALARATRLRRQRLEQAKLERAMEAACETGTLLQKWMATYVVQQRYHEALPDEENLAAQVLDSSEKISSWTMKAVCPI